MLAYSARTVAILVSLAIAPACGGDPDADPADAGSVDAGPDAMAPPENFGEALFLPDTINTVDITIDTADWTELTLQSRSFFGALAGDCQAQPFEKPFTYFPADVVVNGTAVTNVGVRKKGFIGSLSATKPSLKIKFDEFVNGQRLEGLERITLNNQRQDPTLINACLGYGVFRAAGIVAPRCNFAHVTVNGQDLGIYAHVDSLKKKFVRFNYNDDSGNLWEGTLSDFRDEWTGTFELKTNRMTSPPDITEVTAAAAADDAQLISSLSSYMDMDRFYRFWAMETIIGHWDGYSGNSNNFYFYRDPDTGLLDFIPWGADALFRQRLSPFASVQATSQIPRRLYRTPEGQAGYFSAMTDVLDEAWVEADILSELERMVALVRPFVDAAQLATFDAEVQGTRDFIASRRSDIETELGQTPPDLGPNLREDFCFDQNGTVSLTIDSLWNAGVANLGTGTLTMTFPGFTQTIVNIDTLVGPANGAAALYLSADLDDGTVVLFVMTMPLVEVTPGGEAVIDWVRASGEMYVTPPGGTQALTSRLAQGTINVSQGATTDGAPVQVSLSAGLHELGF